MHFSQSNTFLYILFYCFLFPIMAKFKSLQLLNNLDYCEQKIKQILLITLREKIAGNFRQVRQ